MMRRILVGVVVLATFLLVPMATNAQDMEQNVFVAKDRVINHNFWRAGDSIDISGTLEKDAYVAGNIVTVDGTIKGDLFGAANTLKINGTVEGNLRFAAETIIINGTVGRNVTALAANLQVSPGATVGWELMAAGNVVEVDGDVGGNMNVAATNLSVNGTVNGRIDGIVERPMQLRDEAKVTGDISIASDHEVQRAAGAEVLGTITLQESKTMDFDINFLALAFWAIAIGFLSALLVGALMVWMAPKFVRMISDELQANLLKDFWVGLLVLVATPILTILLAVTIIGFPLAMMMFVMYLIMLYLSGIFVSVALADWGFKKMKVKSKPKLMALLVVGLFVYTLLTFIPIVGGFIAFIGLCVGLGAMYQMKLLVLKKHFK